MTETMRNVLARFPCWGCPVRLAQPGSIFCTICETEMTHDVKRQESEPIKGGPSVTTNARKAYRKAILIALLWAALISCGFGVCVIPIEHFMSGASAVVAVWLLKLVTGSLSVLAGAEACKECLSRKHDMNHPDCPHWEPQT
jgi:hypothetical protein